MVYVYPNTISTFVGDPEIAIRHGYVPIEEETYADLLETKLMWQDGELVEDPTYEERKREREEEAERERAAAAIINEVNELKKKLSDTDYMIIKIAEGAAERSEYAEFIAKREEWRARINELENGGV